MRCVFCLTHLETHQIAAGMRACDNCGLRYSVELLDTLNTEDYLDNPRYAIQRIDGHPPDVVITDLEAAS